MFPKKSVFLLFFVLLMSVTACKKEEVNIYNSLKDFFNKQLTSETFVVDASTDVYIEGKEGTQLFIPETAFDDSIGEVTINFGEFFRKSDLILNNIPTNTTDGRWLESGGTFFFYASNSAGNRVPLSQEIQLTFPVLNTVSNPNGMSVWRGDGERPLEFNGWRGVGDFGSVGTNSSGTEGELEFILQSRAFSWINCDYVFDNEADQVKVEATVVNSDAGLTDVIAFIAFKNINAVLGLSVENRTFKSFDIPVGEEAYLVILGHKDGLFLKVEPFTVAANQHFELELDRVSEDELRAELLLLD